MSQEPPDDTLKETMEALQEAISQQPKVCPSCGEPFPEGAAMCPHCGAEISTAGAELPPPPPPDEAMSAAGPPISARRVGTLGRPTGFAAEVAPEPPPPEAVTSPPFESQEPELTLEEAATAEEVSSETSGVASSTKVTAGPPPSPRRLWAAVAVGVGAYLIGVPAGLPFGIGSVAGAIPAAAVMVLGAVAVATGVGLFAVSTRRVETVARAVVTEYVCPLCGTDVAPDATDCPTCGARLTD